MSWCVPAMMFAEGEAASITRHHVLPLQGRLALHAIVEVAPRLFKRYLLGFLSLLKTISFRAGGHVVREGHEELKVCNA